MKIWLLVLLLDSVLAGCSAMSSQNVAMQAKCGKSSICTHIQVSGDRVYFGITNNSSEIIYVPWISGVNSMTSGFVVRRRGADAKGFAKSTTSPAGAPFEGETLLVPNSFYGISITKAQAKSVYELKDGCQEVVVEFRAARIDEQQGSGQTPFAASPPTQICL